MSLPALFFLLTWLSVVLAAALPQDPSITTNAGPTCTLVDGGPPGGTFCNVYLGTMTLTGTQTDWVTTGKHIIPA
jgi:hypothetical protein